MVELEEEPCLLELQLLLVIVVIVVVIGLAYPYLGDDRQYRCYGDGQQILRVKDAIHCPSSFTLSSYCRFKSSRLFRLHHAPAPEVSTPGARRSQLTTAVL